MRLIIFLVFFQIGHQHFLAQAVEKIPAGDDPIRDDISNKYQAGAYLIYDCGEGHWVCVREEDFKECRAQYEEDRQNDKGQYSCVPVEEFKIKKSCFQKQLYLVSNAYGGRFCVNEKRRDREILFK